MLARVDHFEIVGPYRLSVAFNDGSRGEHDFRLMVMAGKGVLAELSDQALFDRVSLDFGALTWPNGFDISPEWLRREMLEAGELRSAEAAE
jgi:hypothetical protein